MSDGKLNGSGRLPTQEYSLDLQAIKGWALAYLGHQSGIIGHVTAVTMIVEGQDPPDSITLNPSWTFIGEYQVMRNAQGQPNGIGWSLSIAPTEFLSAAGEEKVRPVRVLMLSSLSDEDFAFLAPRILHGVKVAEGVRSGSRAKKAGIEIVGADALTKLPKV